MSLSKIFSEKIFRIPDYQKSQGTVLRLVAELHDYMFQLIAVKNSNTK